ncbi:poly-gamma-glutamate hydrolase family protein [Dactylosporangium roseum]|uniref:Poly-gamma-glutamate hydrolase family protein n=1 Tax=Dactylosporangium roseum TaxID=47989 RepID=A0ABY5Z877_9ACTN|nr:poly-gamma-glutamate hydrolase family protein [Dactylosporangium roseum]UWZ37849.1 poly-gamma-glutamate hydrolase family protein [Dactylosporangium roseum]
MVYANYAELAGVEVAGVDYRIARRYGRSQLAHISIHGGGIEVGTTEAADAASGDDRHGYYTFEGLKPSGNSVLHITSTQFDEPLALQLVGSVERVVSWHGASGGTAQTWVGGLDTELRDAIRAALTRAGFTATLAADDRPEIQGQQARNIANLSRRGAGVQLELSTAQREAFFPGGDTSRVMRESGQRTAAFAAYIAAVNSAIDQVLNVPAPIGGDEAMPLVQIGDILCSVTPDEAGVLWICEDVQGWGSPGSTLDVAQRSGDHGGWGGDAYLVPRIMVIKGTLMAPSAAAAVDALSRLYRAIPLTLSPLTITEAGLARTCMVRRQDDVIPTWISTRDVEWSVQVEAPDPRKYAASPSAVSTGLPLSSGGLRAPVRAPLRSVATVASGVISANNAGDFPTRPAFRIDGPVVGPRIVHIASQRSLGWDLTLSAGQWLDVDVDLKTSLINGQASRNGVMTARDWFDLDPGITEIGFTAANYTSAVLTCSWRSAWM